MLKPAFNSSSELFMSVVLTPEFDFGFLLSLPYPWLSFFLLLFFFSLFSYLLTVFPFSHIFDFHYTFI